jgi:teichuronic acid biosynthesis glycosyltransferase TuaH
MSESLIWLSGVTWDNTNHTDRLLVEAIAETYDVVFVDSPHRCRWGGWLRVKPPAVEQVLPRVLRLRVPAPPLATKPVGRAVTRALQLWTLRRGLPAGTIASAVVVASPVTRFPPGLRGRRILYLTDDWVAGAPLMGLSSRWVRRVVAANAREADALAAVSPALLGMLSSLGTKGMPAEVVPNGAPPPYVPPHGSESVAFFVGNLNERIDLAYLEAVVDVGVKLRVVGPCVSRDPTFRRRLKTLLNRSGVEWVGHVVPSKQVAQELASVRVGLLPYATTSFNHGSFPMKIMDYLAAGLPVVSTNLQASRWLASEHIRIADDPEEFASHVLECIASPPSPEEVESRHRLVRNHGWPKRARKLLQLAGI